MGWCKMGMVIMMLSLYVIQGIKRKLFRKIHHCILILSHAHPTYYAEISLKNSIPSSYHLLNHFSFIFIYLSFIHHSFIHLSIYLFIYLLIYLFFIYYWLSLTIHLSLICLVCIYFKFIIFVHQTIDQLAKLNTNSITLMDLQTYPLSWFIWYESKLPHNHTNTG